jgi:hypothetical protein
MVRCGLQPGVFIPLTVKYNRAFQKSGKIKRGASKLKRGASSAGGSRCAEWA